MNKNLTFKRVEIGLIPIDWNYIELSKILSKISNEVAVYPDSSYQEIGIRSHGKGIFHKSPILGKDLGNKKVFWVEKNALILNIVFAWEQAVSVTSESENGFIASHRFPMFKPVTENFIDIHFLKYFFLTKRGKWLLTLASPGGAGRNKTLGQSEFLKIKIPLPPLAEQIKIAQILSTWDNAIAQTQQLIEAKQRLKQGLMQQLLTGRMRFKEYVQSSDIKNTRFYSYPSDWAHPKIQDFAKEVTERNANGEAMTVLSCSKYSGFVNSLEYFGKQVFSDDTSNYKVIYRHQFGFPANHIEEGSIGLLKHVDKGIVSPIYIIFDVDKTKVNPDYLYLILKSETYKHIFRSRTSASVDRRGSLRWDEFSEIKVPMPSLSEQARIVNLFESCTQVIACLESKKNVLAKQKQGLMQVLLTGKIRVHGEDS